WRCQHQFGRAGIVGDGGFLFVAEIAPGRSLAIDQHVPRHILQPAGDQFARDAVLLEIVESVVGLVRFQPGARLLDGVAVWYAVQGNAHGYIFNVNSVKLAPCSSGCGSSTGFGCVELFSSQYRLLAESACASASSCVTTPSLISASSACSKVCEPADMLFSIASLICVISPFSINSAMCGVFSMTSTAARRPPLIDVTRRCDTMPRSVEARSFSSDWRVSSGKKLMIRISAW